MLHDASIVGFVFGRFPDEALDCDPERWAMRCAGAELVLSDENLRRSWW